MAFLELTPEFAVSGQIRPEDVQDLANQGFETLICNRPAFESAPDEQPEALESAAKAAGLTFHNNPIVMSELGLEQVEAQKTAIDGKTIAYCTSGTRSAILWAFAEAGSRDTAEILAALRSAGFQLDHLASQIEALAARATQG